MSKDKLTDYSATNSLNTDVGGVNIDEGMLPSDVNNALREVMTHLKDFAEGTQAVNNIKFAGATTTGDINFGDNDKAVFGAGSDFEIVHTGTNTNLRENGTGNLNVWGDDIYFYNSAGTETKASYLSNGAVTLYYDNAQKLATTATGADITGTLTADGLTVDGDATISGSAPRFFIKETDSADGNIRFSLGGGEFYIASVDDDLNYVGYLARFSPNNDVALYADDGTTQGFYWDASTQRLGLGTTGPANNLHIYATSYPAIRLDDGTAYSSIYSDSTDGSLVYSADDGNARANSKQLFYVDGSEKMRITSAGNVGIGNASPDSRLYVSGSTGTTGFAKFTDDVTASLLIGVDSTSPYVHSNNGTLRFGTNTNNTLAERMRIDSSGRLLVGKTSTGGGTTEGTEIHSDGYTQIVRDSFSNNPVVYLGKLTNDGEIVRLTKDGTTVGSIGSRSSGTALQIYTSNTGIDFGGDGILPMVGSTITDNSRDIGSGSYRFKDLYLSGGVYLGGTGSANLLDDYEEGTFTPEVYDASSGGNQITSSSASGSYTKVGNLVTVHFYTYNLDTTGATAANTLHFRNLPFTAATFANHGNGLGAVRYHEIITNGGDLTAQTSAGNAHAIIYAMGNDVGDYTIRVQDIGNSGVSDIEFTVTYRAA